jgi:hypothetical protein
VILRLEELEFRVRQGDGLELFGEELPLLKAIAVDDRTHQFVLVAEQDSRPTENEAATGERKEFWRELLFAVSGLRHHLRGASSPALGPPILLAVVNEDEAKHLRGLAEDIAKDYALFSRIEINIVRADLLGVDDGQLVDLALAPLLPRLRSAFDEGTTVATQDIEQFWTEMEAEVHS